MRPGPSKRIFDAAAFKREFPGLANPQLHYLDNAATAQVPDVVLEALRRFEVEVRANVHEGMHARARAATKSYNQARASVARFLQANSDQEVVFTYGTTSSINLLAHSFGGRLEPGNEILLSVLEHHSNLVPLHSDFDQLNGGQSSSGRCLGSTSSSMLRATLGCFLMKPARSSVSTIW